MGDENDFNGHDIMTDDDFERAIELMQEQAMLGDGDNVSELLKLMNESKIISWEEAERILGDTMTEPVKCSLPPQTRPSETDNETNVDRCIQQLMDNDPKLKEINLNNMKRTPIPQVKRMIEALHENQYLEKLSLANMGLYDHDIIGLVDVLENNEVLRCINLETNYLSGEFFAKLFQAMLKFQQIEEFKAVNQGVSFSTESERDIMKAIFENRGLIKISMNLRLPEGRHKLEQATIRNQEIRRILRRQAALEAKAAEEERKKALAAPLTTRPDKAKPLPALPKAPAEPPRILAEPPKPKPAPFEPPKPKAAPAEPPRILAEPPKPAAAIPPKPEKAFPEPKKVARVQKAWERQRTISTDDEAKPKPMPSKPPREDPRIQRGTPSRSSFEVQSSLSLLDDQPLSPWKAAVESRKALAAGKLPDLPVGAMPAPLSDRRKAFERKDQVSPAAYTSMDKPAPAKKPFQRADTFQTDKKTTTSESVVPKNKPVKKALQRKAAVPEEEIEPDTVREPEPEKKKRPEPEPKKVIPVVAVATPVIDSSGKAVPAWKLAIEQRKTQKTPEPREPAKERATRLAATRRERRLSDLQHEPESVKQSEPHSPLRRIVKKKTPERDAGEGTPRPSKSPSPPKTSAPEPPKTEAAAPSAASEKPIPAWKLAMEERKRAKAAAPPEQPVNSSQRKLSPRPRKSESPAKKPEPERRKSETPPKTPKTPKTPRTPKVEPIPEKVDAAPVAPKEPPAKPIPAWKLAIEERKRAKAAAEDAAKSSSSAKPDTNHVAEETVTSEADALRNKVMEDGVMEEDDTKKVTKKKVRKPSTADAEGEETHNGDARVKKTPPRVPPKTAAKPKKPVF